MRLNRKWLYLGGLVTILTLLLTLTLVLPAGAVGQLDRGSLDTDNGYVSPDPDVENGDMIEVTLSNAGLDRVSTVEDGGDIDPVVITTPSHVSAASVSLIRVNIEADEASPAGVMVDLPEGTATTDVLPITGALSIDFEAANSVPKSALGTPVIVNAANGLIEIPVRADIDSPNNRITLSYETSPQETALLNVSGDSSNFDLLAVESAAGPAGDYSATVMAAEEVIIEMHPDVRGDNNGIVHEQHAVPSGLRGFIEVDDEEITKFYTDANLTTEVTIPDAGYTGDMWVQLEKPPVRNMSLDAAGRFSVDNTALAVSNTGTDPSNKTTGKIKLTATNFNDDDIEVSYFGSDSFYIEVNHGPIQNRDDVVIVVPIMNTDDSSDSMDKLQIISFSDGVDDTCQDCRVRIGVVTLATDDDEPTALDARISVLGISYEGSERVNVPSGLETDEIWPAILDFDPVDANGDGEVDGDDITIVTPSSDVRVAPRHDDDDGEAVDIVDDNSVLLQFTGTGTTSENATVDVAYALRVGANPRNALIPDETDRPIVAVAAGSRVAFTSDNDRATVDAEVEGPAFVNPNPANMGATDDDAQVISIDVTDELAGVDKDSIQLMVSVGGATALPVANDELSFSEIGGGYRASIALDDIENIPNIRSSETTPVEWFAMADDNAGNSAMSDSDADEDERQDYAFNVDGEDAEITRVYTGDWFDAVAEKVMGDRRLSADKYLPGVSDNTSVRVVFNERIDGTTVSVDDFSVDGAAPTDAQWSGTGETGDGDDTHIGQSVFLTVPAMAADAKPVVNIVGSVSDVAGNTTNSGTKTADDGIAPTTTLSVDKALSDKKVTVTVESDERIRTLSPDLALYISNGPAKNDESDTFTVGREDPDDDTTPLVLRDAAGNELASSGEILAGDVLTLRLSKAPILDSTEDGKVDHRDVSITDGDSLVTLEQTEGNVVAVVAKSGEVRVKVGSVNLAKGNKITVTYRGTDADPAKGEDGVPNPSGKQVSSTSWTFALNVSRNDRYAATATAEDSSRNRRTGGKGDPTATGATVFEIDNKLAGGESATTMPIHDAPGNTPVSITNPFVIELIWNGEKGEYPGDSSNAVTLTKAELDGTDVMGDAVAQNDRSYRISIRDIALGDHTLKYNAEDALGNTNATDRVLRFTVQAVPTWKLGLSAGMNLISLPSNPASTNVNDVFGATSQIELIFTFEGAQSKVALRNPRQPPMSLWVRWIASTPSTPTGSVPPTRLKWRSIYRPRRNWRPRPTLQCRVASGTCSQ